MNIRQKDRQRTKVFPCIRGVLKWGDWGWHKGENSSCGLAIQPHYHLPKQNTQTKFIFKSQLPEEKSHWKYRLDLCQSLYYKWGWYWVCIDFLLLGKLSPQCPSATLHPRLLGHPKLITVQKPQGSPGPVVGPKPKGASTLTQGFVPYKSLSSLTITPSGLRSFCPVNCSY